MTLIIGDPHGCVNELKSLIELYGKDKQVIIVGDLVGKGPFPMEVVKYVKDNGFLCVMGNHDMLVLHCAYLLGRLEISGVWGEYHASGMMPCEMSHIPEHCEIAKNMELEYLEWLAELPAFYRGDEFVVVHAGVVPGVSVEEQKLVDLLYVRNVYSKSDGTLVGTDGIDIGDSWLSQYEGDDFLVFGHDARRKLQVSNFGIGLDTGCCYGGKLTGVIFPSKEIVSVDAEKNYCSIKIRSITNIPNTKSKIPMIGLGTWKSEPGQVKNAVKIAVRNGYRHIDCAHIYNNEAEIGDALTELFEEGFKREDLWITSKLWNTDHHPDSVRSALDTTLSNLKLDYIDLYLIHWPVPYAKIGDVLFPKDDNGEMMVTFVSHQATWKAMENLVDEGVAKFIGLSNFNENQIRDILIDCEIRPSFLQCESHPYLPQKELMLFCREEGIVFEGYSPLGSPDRPGGQRSDDPTPLLQHPIVQKIAEEYGKNAGQILLRFQTQRGNVVLAKSVTDERIISNIDVFDFTMKEEDLSALEELQCDWRACTLYSQKLHPYHPFY